MKFFRMPITIALLAFSGTAAFSQATECSVGTWAPDYDMLLARIASQLEAPNASASGTLSMVIQMAHSQKEADEEMQIHADDWSFSRGEKDSLTGELFFVLNGVANYTLSATSSGSFHINQQSNTYIQIERQPMLSSEIPVDVFEPMLPVGEWANGTLSCDDDVIQFTIFDQDSDGHLVETWYRQK